MKYLDADMAALEQEQVLLAQSRAQIPIEENTNEEVE